MGLVKFHSVFILFLFFFIPFALSLHLTPEYFVLEQNENEMKME